MYLNTGYLNHSHMDFKDKSRPLIVGSCGTYRLSRHPKLPTYRPRGRLDYQIIYITAGCGHFHFDNVNNETIVPAGNIVLYRPKELQKYEYYGEDKTEVYWIHFTGSNVTMNSGTGFIHICRLDVKGARLIMYVIRSMVSSGSCGRVLRGEICRLFMENWNTIYKCFAKWEQTGVFESIFKILSEDADTQDVSIDSSCCKAHQHSAGAEKGALIPGLQNISE